MAQIPAAIGLFVCEQVIVEELTKNVTPVNCFRRRAVRQFPSEPFEFVVIAFLNDGNGEVQLELAIRRLDEFEDIYRRSVLARFPSPLHEIRAQFRIRDCSFPVAGAYEVVLFASGESVAVRRIHIAHKE
jgi:hypothetical protein